MTSPIHSVEAWPPGTEPETLTALIVRVNTWCRDFNAYVVGVAGYPPFGGWTVDVRLAPDDPTWRVYQPTHDEVMRELDLLFARQGSKS